MSGFGAKAKAIGIIFILLTSLIFLKKKLG
jgi:hypothetical protein